MGIVSFSSKLQAAARITDAAKPKIDLRVDVQDGQAHWSVIEIVGSRESVLVTGTAPDAKQAAISGLAALITEVQKRQS